MSSDRLDIVSARTCLPSRYQATHVPLRDRCIATVLDVTISIRLQDATSQKTTSHRRENHKNLTKRILLTLILRACATILLLERSRRFVKFRNLSVLSSIRNRNLFG
jgi:hypothetical protein